MKPTLSRVSNSLYLPLCLWLTVILWSSALVAIRVGLHSYSPGALALLRYLVASVCLLFLYFRLPERRLPSFRELLHIIFVGTLGIGIYNVAINYGEVAVSAGIAGFIIGLMPVFTMIFAFLLLKEKTPLKSWWGVIISFTGLFLIALSGQQDNISFNIGLLYVLLASCLGSYYATAQKKLFHRYNPLELVILSIWSGTLVMLFYTPSLIKELPKASWEATAAAIYLGVFPAAVAYALWNFALSKTSAGRASAYLYAMPIITILLGMILLHEYPRTLEWIGGLITLLGAVIINYFYNQTKNKVATAELRVPQ